MQMETSTSIFNNDFSDNDCHQDQLYSGPAEGAGRTAAAPNPDVIPDDASAHLSVASEPTPPTIPKKRGWPSKKAQVEAVKEPEPLLKTVSVMFYLAIFSEVEMKKPEKQCKPSNTFLQMKSDCKWDTTKVQLLEKISQVLHPKLINFNNYIFSWSVPCYQSSQMQLHTDDDYRFLITHALKPKEAAANIRIEMKLTEACVFDSVPHIYT
ncbi:hypothetical protein SCLCIDRAFT_31321 [Scleroderma citrinum Foug A]|uniref:Uncharacterized protein n=1 Tax=Scleroderma citrinum Foug A TaxID=1036808 RepID=A0A0C2YX22_9AGAM|nr:hypothetical protein SCLCIDRAFT_31321 [Scleroderma citrinum Foug A]